jgi:hypothetical protein
MAITVALLMVIVASYGVGLRVSQRFPFLTLAAPMPPFDWVIRAAARSRLRKRETLADWFRYREGREPKGTDLARVQLQAIASFVVILLVFMWEASK